MGHKIRCYQIKEWTWRPSGTKSAVVQETHENIGQRGAQPSEGVRPERSGVPQTRLISKALWSCAMQQGKTQSFILIPGWGQADTLPSFPRTADTRNHTSTAEFPCYACVSFGGTRRHPPTRSCPHPRVSLEGRKTLRAESTLITGDASHQDTGHSERTWSWDQLALFLPCIMLSGEKTIEKILLGSTHLLNKGAHAGEQPGCVLTQLLRCWACKVEIKAFLEFQALKREDWSQEPGRLPR